MISESLRQSRDVWFWPALLALLCAALELLGDQGRSLLGYERALVDAGQLWRLLTANFVHLGPYHLLLNLIGILVFVLLCGPRWSGRGWLLRLLVLSLAVTLGLHLFAPHWSGYVGLSGVMHGLFLLGLVPLVRAGDRIALVALLYLFGKLGWELATGAAVSDEARLGARVVLESHLFGTIGGLAYGLAAALVSRFARPQAH